MQGPSELLTWWKHSSNTGDFVIIMQVSISMVSDLEADMLFQAVDYHFGSQGH